MTLDVIQPPRSPALPNHTFIWLQGVNSYNAMLGQCRRSIEPSDVATAADSTSGELTEGIMKNERTDAQLEEDVSMKVDSFCSERDEESEQEDKSCVAS
jgi:hypothetical protein